MLLETGRRARAALRENGFDAVAGGVVFAEDGGAVEEADATDGAPQDFVVMRCGGLPLTGAVSRRTGASGEEPLAPFSELIDALLRY